MAESPGRMADLTNHKAGFGSRIAGLFYHAAGCPNRIAGHANRTDKSFIRTGNLSSLTIFLIKDAKNAGNHIVFTPGQTLLIKPHSPICSHNY
jgi:hypothetical protein